MKTLILTFLFVPIIAGCNFETGNNPKNTNENILSGSLELKDDSIEEDVLSEYKLWELEDSIRMAKALDNALKIAKEDIEKSAYSGTFESFPDSAYLLKTSIKLGSLFSRIEKHLIIYRINPGDIYINIYRINEGDFTELLKLERLWYDYKYDTIFDVNGDKINDYVINWYGNSGCCLKAYSTVHLGLGGEKGFSEEFVFINPTFSPLEKVIRGVCYGHPGDTELYKYKWNSLKVDTIEFVYPDRNQEGRFIKANRRYYEKGERIEKSISSVPIEYRKIFGYDWFTGNAFEK